MLHCVKCLTSRSGDVLGAPCRTPWCDGVIELAPTFASLIDVLPEPMTCARRHRGEDGQDRWEKFKRIDNRVCSYCGSLHPDDLFRLVAESASAPPDAPYHSVVEIEPSEKSYKIYVHQPGVRNAHEGAIKFYTHHLPHDANGHLAVSDEQQADYAAAVKASRARFNLAMKARESGPHE